MAEKGSTDHSYIKAMREEERQNTVYRDAFYAMLNLIRLETFVIVGLCAALLFQVYQGRPDGGFFADNVSDVRTRLVGLFSPNITANTVLDWATQAGPRVTTLSFNKINEEFSAYRSIFTDSGRVKFTRAFGESQVYKDIIKNRQFMTTVPRDKPVLMKEGLIEGRYTWIVNLPVYVTVRAGTEKKISSGRLTMHIIKVPTRVNPQGIAIETFEFR